MKIAFFVHGYLPWDAYGVPRYVERLGSYLAGRGHQIYVIAVGRPNLPKVEKPKTNLTIYRTCYVDLPSKRLRPFWSFAYYTFGSLLEASKLINKEDIQILHGHTVRWGGLQSALVSRVTHKPFIVTLHGSGLGGYSEIRTPQHLRFLRWADIVICRETSAVRKLISCGFPEKKVILLSEGCIDTEKFRPSENKMPKGPPIVTFVGRLIPFKGPQLLLEAAPHILSRHTNTVFQLVGEGESKDYLMTKARSMGIADHVKFFGLRSDVDKILRSSDVFVSLSPYENIGAFALLEAMSTGIPVVATDVGETRTIVKDGETGLLAKCDSRDIAEKVARVLDDRNLVYNMARNERQLIVKEHSLEVFCKKYETIYGSVIQRKAPL